MHVVYADYQVVKAHAKRTQQVTTLLRVVGGFWPTIVRRLRGPKCLTGFKLCATIANKCQHCCGSMQMDVTCWAQQCCVFFAWALIHSWTVKKFHIASSYRCRVALY